jgi:glycosyl hydrolase family 43/flagellar hook capping protein FlgD
MVLAMALAPPPAQAAWMLPPQPYRAKDFTFIKRDGWYHCFYIRTDDSVPYDSTERELGHAMSKDLYLWTNLPPVLHVRPDQWDDAKVWAPHILEVDGVYYMFYTGVTNDPGVYAFHQRIGVATSTDLMTWNRLDAPVLACGQIRWSSCNTEQFAGGEFRDPFVMPNPDGPGWLMYYTTRPSSAANTFVVGVAASTGDFTQWSDLKAMWITQWNWSGSATVESPHLFQHAGTWYFVFSGDAGQPLRLATGPSATGDPETWTPRGTLATMLNTDTHFWFASEHFVDGTHEYFAFVNYDRVDVRELVWGTDWRFALEQPDLFHVQQLTWNASQTTVGSTVDLRIDAVNTLNRSVFLEAVEVDASGSEEPIPLEEIGLPASIPLTGLVTHYTWIAHGWPDPEDQDLNAEIVVRTTDHTATAAPIVVAPDPITIVPGTGSGDGDRRIPREFVEFGRSRADFRTLVESPVGGLAMLIDLPEAATVRVDLFDLAGRRIRNLADRTLPAGATVISWDGRDAGGQPARPGIYFARLTTPHGQRTVRLAVGR